MMTFNPRKHLMSSYLITSDGLVININTGQRLQKTNAGGVVLSIKGRVVSISPEVFYVLRQADIYWYISTDEEYHIYNKCKMIEGFEKVHKPIHPYFELEKSSAILINTLEGDCIINYKGKKIFTRDGTVGFASYEEISYADKLAKDNKNELWRRARQYAISRES